MLQDLALKAGRIFIVRDGEGRELAIGSGASGHSQESLTRSRSDDPDLWRPVTLPGGGGGAVRVASTGLRFEAADTAWTVAAASLITSTSRLVNETDSLSAELARVYEELSVLHGSGAALVGSDSLQTTCQRTLALATRHIPARAAAIYVRGADEHVFNLTAHNGAAGLWMPEVRINLDSPRRHPSLSGQCLLSERASVVDLASVGFAHNVSASLLCAPLCVDLGGEHVALGWLALYERIGDDPFLSHDAKLATALAAQGAVAIANSQLVEERRGLLMGTIRSLVSALDAKDQYTHGHSRRVTEHSLRVAGALGLPAVDLDALELAGLLHDIGKIGVPDRVLLKTGTLDDEEWEQMKRHPVIGSSIIATVPGLHPFVSEGIRFHHERYDGRGYPDHLSGDEIPLAGRLISVGDCFDAMTTDRPYRSGMAPAEAIARMLLVSGQQFDPDILREFVRLFKAGLIRQS